MVLVEAMRLMGGDVSDGVFRVLERCLWGGCWEGGWEVRSVGGWMVERGFGDFGRGFSVHGGWVWLGVIVSWTWRS